MFGDKAKKAKQAFDGIVKELQLDKFATNKKRLLVYLCLGHSNVSVACKNAGLSRQTHHNYMNDDPEFRKMSDLIKEITFDFVESKLFQNIASLKENSIFYWLNNQGNSRGYHKRMDITTNGQEITEKIDYKKISKAQGFRV